MKAHYGQAYCTKDTSLTERSRRTTTTTPGNGGLAVTEYAAVPNSLTMTAAARRPRSICTAETRQRARILLRRGVLDEGQTALHHAPPVLTTIDPLSQPDIAASLIRSLPPRCLHHCVMPCHVPCAVRFVDRGSPRAHSPRSFRRVSAQRTIPRPTGAAFQRQGRALLRRAD